jgi:hypothetical protein
LEERILYLLPKVEGLTVYQGFAAELGRGGYGVVKIGTLLIEGVKTRVAIKMLKLALPIDELLEQVRVGSCFARGGGEMVHPPCHRISSARPLPGSF